MNTITAIMDSRDDEDEQIAALTPAGHVVVDSEYVPRRFADPEDELEVWEYLLKITFARSERDAWKAWVADIPNVNLTLA